MQKLQLFSTTAGQTSLQPALGQACDQCRRRKSRCNRACPCVHCFKTGQACSYDQAPRTRGRKPRRRNTGDEALPRHIEDQPEVVLWTEDLTDLTCDNMSLSLAMEDQQLPPTPISSLDWQDPCIISTPILSPDLVKTGNLNNGSWLSPIVSPQVLDRSCFIPYVQQFFDRLYAVFPVVERDQLLDIVTNPHLQGQPLPSSIYTFLTALSAAVTVQLNLSDQDSSSVPGSLRHITSEGVSHTSSTLSPDLLIAQCLETRRNEGFIENADEWTILTSFFLFAYYGNCDQPRSAWYYLREAIGFAQSLGLDDPDMYVMLDPKTAQRRRLLFWLLFVTERAYALQHRSRVILQNTIPLPHVFESPEPQLMYGFVTLARVFSSVDHSFITAWRNQQTPLLARVSGDTRHVLSRLLREDVSVDVVEMNETQRLDVLVTQQWLKTLAWRLKCSVDESSQMVMEGGDECAKTCRESSCIITASKNLLHIVNTASSPSLEAHGIGMEQKVSDVANCLCEVLETSVEPEVALEFFSTQDFLHQFMVFLADFRRRESQYLQPLLERATRSLSCCVEPQRALLLDEGEDWMCKSLVEEPMGEITS